MKKVHLYGQVILAIIPTIVGQAYAFHRIKKTKVGITIIAIVYVLATIPEMILFVYDYPFGTSSFFNELLTGKLTTIILISLIPTLFALRWTKQYNMKLSIQSAVNTNNTNHENNRT